MPQESAAIYHIVVFIQIITGLDQNRQPEWSVKSSQRGNTVTQPYQVIRKLKNNSGKPRGGNIVKRHGRSASNTGNLKD
jgi:hypothetical protein